MASDGQDRTDALGWGRRPTRPKTFARNLTIPHKSYICFYLRQRAGVLRALIKDRGYGLRRIPLPRTLVNKGKRKAGDLRGGPQHIMESDFA
jgi:hypothetical protein